MNSITIAVPHKWGSAVRLIVRFLLNPRRLQTAALGQFKVDVVPPVNEDQILAVESTLDAAQALFCDAAIVALNTALHSKTSDGWRATKEVTEQAQRDVDDIESIRAMAGGITA